MNADEIGRILDELGKRLGPAGSHVFELATRQAVLEGVVAAVLLAAAVIVFTVVTIAGYRSMKADGELNPVAWSLAIWSIGVGFAFMIASPFLLKAANPEYAAIRDLIGQIR